MNSDVDDLIFGTDGEYESEREIKRSACQARLRPGFLPFGIKLNCGAFALVAGARL